MGREPAFYMRNISGRYRYRPLVHYPKKVVENGYLLPFKDGVYLITDWHINNHIRKDRYCPTSHKEFKRMVGLDENGRYALGIPMVDPDKDSIG